MLLLNTMYQVEQEYKSDPDQFKDKADNDYTPDPDQFKDKADDIF